ncbi:MAG: hypothetical protein AAFZ52_02730 [Bacteroidota bacterium]
MRFSSLVLFLCLFSATTFSQDWSIVTDLGAVKPVSGMSRTGGSISLGIERAFRLDDRVTFTAATGVIRDRYFNDEHFFPESSSNFNRCLGECTVRNERYTINRLNVYAEAGLRSHLGKFQIGLGVRLNYHLALRFTEESYPSQNVDPDRPRSTSTFAAGERIFRFSDADRFFHDYRPTTEFPLEYFTQLSYPLTTRWALGLTWRANAGRYDLEQISYRIRPRVVPQPEIARRREIVDLGWQTFALSARYQL